VNEIFHNYPGYFMVPLALGLLFLEMQILSRLVVEDTSVSAKPMGMGMGIGTVK